jgi:hypothetical protein
MEESIARDQLVVRGSAVGKDGLNWILEAQDKVSEHTTT